MRNWATTGCHVSIFRVCYRSKYKIAPYIIKKYIVLPEILCPSCGAISLNRRLSCACVIGQGQKTMH